MLFKLTRVLRIALFSVVVASVQQSAFAVDNTSGRALLTAVACDEKLEIDGKLTDTVWIHSIRQRLFFAGRDHGYVTLCHDDECLYLAISCNERNPYSVPPLLPRETVMCVTMRALRS